MRPFCGDRSDCVAVPLRWETMESRLKKKVLMMNEMIVRGTAQLAVMFYLARLICDSSPNQSGSNRRVSRLFWTAGCICLVLHALVAFHVVHGWNHSAAFTATAKRTFEMTGWNSGAGLYVNEAFLALWIADVVLWWRRLDWPDNRRIYWALQSVFAFLMFQATAVFGPPFWKPIVLMVSILLLTRILRRRRNPD